MTDPIPSAELAAWKQRLLFSPHAEDELRMIQEIEVLRAALRVALNHLDNGQESGMIKRMRALLPD